MRRRIYLMRHGDVSYFDRTNNPTLSTSDLSLNAEGRAQAQAAQDLLADVEIDRAVASSLPRSIETATIVVKDRGLTVETEEDLREIQPGVISSLSSDERHAAFSGAFDNKITRESRFLGGENFASFEDRVFPCIARLLADQHWKNMLIVAHGGVNRLLLSRALNSGLESFGALEQDQACVNIIDIDANGRMLLRLINFTPYNHNKKGLNLTTMERLYEQYKEMIAKG